MPIDTFTKSEFEAALPVDKNTGDALWQPLDLIKGEYAYILPVDGTNKRIVVRSSVKQNETSASCGKDSIRLWVEYHYMDQWFALGKLDAHTKRTKNWRENMTNKLRKLYQMALEDSNVSNTNSKPDMAPAKPAEDTNAVQPANERKLENTTSKPPVSDLSTVLAEMAGDETPEPEPKKEPNSNQRKAITAPIDKAIRVLAPPGSGKTFVIARRYSHLLENGAEPNNILAVTYSKTMATELLERIIRVNPNVRGTQTEQLVCTIHAATYRILKAEGDKRNVAKEWQVKRAIQDIAESLWTYEDERPGWKEIAHWINAAKANGLTSSEDIDFYCNNLGELHGTNLHEVRYQLDNKMKRDSLLTFPDMLYDVEQRLMKDKGFRARWQSKFKWVICDESQDTSEQAMRILTTLAEPQNQVLFVGDVDQLLFRFTGATPEANLYDGFESHYPDNLTVKLTVNYRSTRTIIDTCQALIQYNYSEAGGPYDQKYMKSVEARPNAPEGEPITFEMYDTPEEEAQAIVEDISASMVCGNCSANGCDDCSGPGGANNREPGDFFIGARTRAQLGYLEGPLVRTKIPFINITGGSFWSSRHVADVVAYVRLTHNEDDNEAFKRIFNVASQWNEHPWGSNKGKYCHHRYLGKAFLSACKNSYKNAQSAANRKRSFETGVDDLVAFVNETKASLRDGPSSAIDFIVENCYKQYLAAEEGITSSDEAENGKLEDLATVKDIASQFAKVEDFLSYVAEAVKAAQAAKDKDWGDYVVLSTVHRLKGLERPVVFGVGLSESGETGLLPHTFSKKPPAQQGILPTGGMAPMQDERCIAFVLVSRAQEEVHLSGVRKYRKNEMGPSHFIGQMGIEFTEETLEEMELIEARKCPTECLLCQGNIQIDEEYMSDTFGPSYIHMSHEDWSFYCDDCGQAGLWTEFKRLASKSTCPYFGQEVPAEFEECKECEVAKECYQEYEGVTE